MARGVKEQPAGVGSDAAKVYSVSEITSLIKGTLEISFPVVRVEGEVTDLRRPTSGHVYFTLKDKEAQIRAVMFRAEASDPSRGCRTLREGLVARCEGRISVYEKNGQYQLYVGKVVARGVGPLYEAFEALKKKLESEGLFDPAHKKPLPVLPRTVGVVTSPTGAAIRDILNVIGRRFPRFGVLIFPAKVQGKGAAREIARGIKTLSRRRGVDVLIVGRGGGSLEDLWAFNEEEVARAIYASRVPVVSAVGHEIDFTIADFVADVRAPTPSAAAEMVVQERAALEERLDRLSERMASAVEMQCQTFRTRLALLSWDRVWQRMEDWLRQRAQQVDDLGGRLLDHCLNLVDTRKRDLAGWQGKLAALSPLAVLERGYSLAFRLPGRDLLRDAKQLRLGDEVEVRLRRGRFVSIVEEVDEMKTKDSEEKRNGGTEV